MRGFYPRFVPQRAHDGYVRDVKHRVVGTWRIAEMDLWDHDAIELLGPALLEFRADGTGTLGFIAVEGYVDWKSSAGHATERVEFSWDGNDEGNAVSGCGWAEVAEDGSLHGRIFFHLGDDAGFRASRTGEN
jgi:hypothetical protein